MDNPRTLDEFRCAKCDKLLCKGNLTVKSDFIEIKCRNCHIVCIFNMDGVKVAEGDDQFD